MCVLVVLIHETDARLLLRWGARIARARGLPLRLLVLHRYRQSADPVTHPVTEECDDPIQEAIRREAADLDTEILAPELILKKGPNLLNLALETIEEEKADLVAVCKGQARSELARHLLEKAPCDTLVLRAGSGEGTRCHRILVPAAGGPHSIVALQLAQALAEENDAIVDALYIEPEAGEDADIVGEHILEQTLRKAGLEDSNRIERRVVLDDSPFRGIATAAEEGYDLIIIGASNLGFVRRKLFGTIPNRLLRGEDGTTVAVLRRGRPFLARAAAVLGRWLDRVEQYVPKLSREQRVDLFERLQNGSVLGIDYIALICFSTAIASMGLIQSSPAVVIGAMLVAPLMTPMVGFGLGLVQGNVVLVWEAARSVLVGFLLSLLIGFTAGYLTPIHGLTPELAARGHPNLLDLFIALFSGAAAAYAMGRPGLLGALPGVAIAAALVPPIATAGIAYALGETTTARGAALLFGTNLIAIILASAVTLWILGIRASRTQSRARIWLRRLLLLLVLSAVVLAFPLGSSLLAQIGGGEDRLIARLKEEVHKEPTAWIGSVERQIDLGRLMIVIYSTSPFPEARSRRLARIARQVTGRDFEVHVVTLLEWRSDRPPNVEEP